MLKSLQSWYQGVGKKSQFHGYQAKKRSPLASTIDFPGYGYFVIGY